MAAQRLADLRKDKELEALRKYLIEFDLFPRRKDPEIAPIRVEELKELAKHWKLHRNRGFWRDHPEKDDLIAALHAHITQLEAKRHRKEEATLLTRQHRSTSDAALRAERPRAVSPFRGAYLGDTFSQRGTYDEGMIYLSRMSSAPGDLRGARRPSRAGHESNDDGDDGPLPALGDGSGGPEGAEAGDGGVDEAARQAAKATELELKRKCASSLYKLSYDTGHEASLVNESGLAALVALASSPDAETARYVAAALANLTTHAYARQRMLEEGGVPALLELSNAHADDTREHCAVALARLSFDEGTGYKLVKDGVLSAIKTLLSQGATAPVREACTRAMINLLPAAGSNVIDGLVHSCVVLSDEGDLTLPADAMVNISIVGTGRTSAVDENLMSVITRMAEAADVAVKQKAVVALCNLSAVRQNQDPLVDLGVLDTLRRLLASTGDELVLNASMVAANLSSNRGGLQSKLARGGIVHVLQELSLRGGIEAKQNVALAFANMTWEAACRPVLLSDGAVTVLVPFVTSGDLQCTRDSLVALCNLMSLAETQRLVLEAGVIPAVVELARTAASDTLVSVCSLALFNLSCERMLRDTICEEGGCPVLVSILDSRPSPRDMERCVASIYNLSQNGEAAQERLLKTAAVEAVINTLARRDLSHETQRQCAAVLYNLSAYAPGRDDMVVAGALQPLIKQLAESPRKETRLFVAGALGYLSKVEAAQQGQGLVPCLIALSNTPDPVTLLQCATAFCAMATRRGSRRFLAQDPTITPAVIAMMRSGHGETQARCAATLCLLSREPGCIFPRGTVPDFIVIALLRVTSDDTKVVCARVLFNLLAHPDARQPMLKQGVLYALVKLARLDLQVVRELTVQAIYNLSCDAAFAPDLLSMGMVRVLASIARTPGAHELRGAVAAALTNLTMFRGHEAQFVSEGVLDAVGPLVKLRNTTTRTSVAALLCNLSLAPQTWEHLARPRIVRVLLVMAKSDARDMRRLACLTFRNVSRDGELHRLLVNEDIIPGFVEVLRKSPGAEVAKTVVDTLCNLVLHSPDFQHQLVMAGAVPVLLDLLNKSSDVHTARISGKVVCLVCNLEATMPRIIREGVVQALVVMARSNPDEQTKTDISVALCNLSRCFETLRRMVEDGAIEAVVRLCTPGEGLLSEIFRQRMAATLRNITLHEPSRTLVAQERGAVAVLVELAQASRNGTRRDVAISIYNLCSTLRARKELAKKGAVRALVMLNERGDPETQSVCAVALHALSGDGAQDQAGVVSALLSMMTTDPTMLSAPERSGRVPADPIEPPPERMRLLEGHDDLFNPPHPDTDWRLQVLEHVDTALPPIDEPDLPSDQLPPRLANGDGDGIIGVFEKLPVGMEKRIAGRDLIVQEQSTISAVRSSMGSFVDDDEDDSGERVELPAVRGASR